MMQSIRISIVSACVAFVVGSMTLFASETETSDLYKSKEVRSAYEKGTRDKSGRPGANYWQNGADYSIKAEVNPDSRLLQGSETITYHNNSPDSLKFMVVHLYQNMNKKGGIRNSELAEEAVNDGMKVSKMSIDGKVIDLSPGNKKMKLKGTALTIVLPTPIPPKGSSTIEAEWSFTIPMGSNIRMGTYRERTFFLGYWYPRIAVYDDIYGWDNAVYNGEHEFYHDYGNYDVQITVPETYGVWATGLLLNADDVLAKPVFDKYNQAATSDEVIHVIDVADLESGEMYKKGKGSNTWAYAAKNVPDFAFGMSEEFIWDASSVKLQSGRRALVHAVYDTTAVPYKVVAAEARQTLEFLSNESPGVEYPYPQITVFYGDYGMEFPMIVNDGVFPNRILNVYVHTHEISHMYFPFYVGTNETMYAWMDEGWAYALPIELQKNLSNYDHRIRAAKGYENYAGSKFDLALMTPSTALRDHHLQMASYFKSSVAYEMLKGAVGEETYASAVKEYINRWKGKHPLPYDFFYTFDDVAGESLAWFWEPWFFEQGYPDLGVKEVKTEEGKVRILVEKVGNIPIPVQAKVTLESGKEMTLSKNASVWKTGNVQVWLEEAVDENVASVTLGNLHIPDSNKGNNTWKADG